MKYNFKYKNGYTICSVKGVWNNVVGKSKEEAIENFKMDYRG